MPWTLPTAENPARRVADPALPGLPDDVPVVIRRLGGECQARAVGRGTVYADPAEMLGGLEMVRVRPTH